jgi:hypothetical protein
MAGQSVGSDRTIGQLVADATHDVQGIVRSEIALAKAEVTSGAKVMGKGAGMLAAAGVLAVFGLTFLFHTLAHVLDLWLPLWAGYAIVTGVILLGAGILGLLGRKALRSAQPKPEKAIEQAQATVAAISSHP